MQLVISIAGFVAAIATVIGVVRALVVSRRARLAWDVEIVRLLRDEALEPAGLVGVGMTLGGDQVRDPHLLRLRLLNNGRHDIGVDRWVGGGISWQVPGVKGVPVALPQEFTSQTRLIGQDQSTTIELAPAMLKRGEELSVLCVTQGEVTLRDPDIRLLDVASQPLPKSQSGTRGWELGFMVFAPTVLAAMGGWWFPPAAFGEDASQDLSLSLLLLVEGLVMSAGIAVLVATGRLRRR